MKQVTKEHCNRMATEYAVPCANCIFRNQEECPDYLIPDYEDYTGDAIERQHAKLSGWDY